ncbi:cellulase (glycosyl hydrolase family 5) [Kitasatospora viridis]|uniref:Cellulase (Glycosyl hydrolase family 5) n=1 Tax=Kitasatospora viridis TaxID=281105 RepID=A0A561T616_9ACTN|nr:cellulase (glycosyl hydrolase family 5) [Kitasatospora viridis]
MGGARRRRSGTRWAVAAVVLVSLLLAGCGGATRRRAVPPAPLPPTRPVTGIAYGDRLVWMSDADLAAALDTAVQVGATLVRADLSWDDIQHDGPGSHAWYLFDRVVAAAAARGLTVLPVLTGTPPWARSAGCTVPACGPHDAARFAAFAAAAADRYAPRGVHDWELWNEPNLTTFWAPAADPAGYAATVEAGAAALHHADPHAFVVLGGLSPVGSGHGDLAPTVFLDRVARQGATRAVDAIGYHPYSYPYLPSATTSFGTAWEQIDRTKESLRSVLERDGTPGLPIWLTEEGAPTGGPGAASDGAPGDIGPDTTHVTEQRQAEIAADAARTAAADPGIGALVWYTDRDAAAATGAGQGTSTEDWYGLRRADGSAKPALAALRTAIAQLRAAQSSGAATPAVRTASLPLSRGTAPGTAPGNGPSGRARRSARRRGAGPRRRGARRCPGR